MDPRNTPGYRLQRITNANAHRTCRRVDDADQERIEERELSLPGTSGLEILRYLRKDSELDAVPILTVSSSENPDDIRRVYESSANAYLTKPTDPDEFIQMITAAVRFWMPPISSSTTND